MPSDNPKAEKWAMYAVFLLIIGLFIFFLYCESRVPPKPKPEPLKMPSAEKVGEAVGRTGHNFGKGLIKGWKDVN